MENTRGLSPDCKLPPEIAMAILMGGKEHPCDRCNNDRLICRGEPRKPGNPKTLTVMEIAIYPYEQNTVVHFCCTVSGKKFQFQQTLFRDDFSSLFDLIFNDIKYKVGEFIKNQE